MMPALTGGQESDEDMRAVDHDKQQQKADEDSQPRAPRGGEECGDDEAADAGAAEQLVAPSRVVLFSQLRGFRDLLYRCRDLFISRIQTGADA